MNSWSANRPPPRCISGARSGFRVVLVLGPCTRICVEYDGARGGIASVRALGLNQSKGLVTRSNGVCFGRGGRGERWLGVIWCPPPHPASVLKGGCSPSACGRTTSCGAALRRCSDGYTLDHPLASNWGGYATPVVCMEGLCVILCVMLCVMARPVFGQMHGQQAYCRDI